MVESEASGLSEKVMLDAVKFGHENFIPIIKAIELLAKKAGKPKWEIKSEDHSELKKKITDAFETDLRKAFSEITRKKDQLQFLKLILNQRDVCEEENITENQAMSQLKSLEKIS